MEMQSSEGHDGTTPAVLKAPTAGFSPTTLLHPAGTLPEPAVSVPGAKLTSPAATASADPELEPPDTYKRLKALRQSPYGLRSPPSPQPNWSRLVLPTKIAPASIKFCTTGDERSGTKANDGHAAVVGWPATSIVSLTAKGRP